MDRIERVEPKEPTECQRVLDNLHCLQQMKFKLIETAGNQGWSTARLEDYMKYMDDELRSQRKIVREECHHRTFPQGS